MLINESAHTVDTPSGPMRMNVFSPAVAGSPRFPGIVVFSEIYQVLHVGPKKTPSASAFIRLTRLVSGDGPCRSAGAGNRRRRVRRGMVHFLLCNSRRRRYITVCPESFHEFEAAGTALRCGRWRAKAAVTNCNTGHRHAHVPPPRPSSRPRPQI
jgi:hypothetical protein